MAFCLLYDRRLCDLNKTLLLDLLKSVKVVAFDIFFLFFCENDVFQIGPFRSYSFFSILDWLKPGMWQGLECAKSSLIINIYQFV